MQFGNDALHPPFLHQLIAKDEHGSGILDVADVRRHLFEVILDDQGLAAEYNSPVHLLVRCVGRLEIAEVAAASARDGIEAQVLRQVEQEA